MVKKRGRGVSVFFNKSKKTVFLRLPSHIKEMMRMNDDDSSVVDDGDGVGITMVMWAKMEGAGQQSG